MVRGEDIVRKAFRNSDEDGRFDIDDGERISRQKRPWGDMNSRERRDYRRRKESGTSVFAELLGEMNGRSRTERDSRRRR